MNMFHTSSSVARLGSMFVLVIGFATAAAIAGPGPQFWLIERAAHPAKTAATADKAERCNGCNGVKTVDIVVTKSSWQNGRGPLTAITDTRTRTCPDCAGAITGRTPEWANGRGPLKPVVVPSSGQTPIAVSTNDRRG